MRKRNIAVLLLTALLLTGLTGCAQRGDTSGVEIVAGTSERFSDEDIRGAEDDGGTIVLLASVYARDPGRRSGLTAGETYADWPFVLERRGSGWHVVSSGY